MMCKYAYYDNSKVEDYPHLYCKLQENKYCPYTRKCMRVHKFIPQNTNFSCGIFEKAKYENVPNNANIIELKHKGWLYIKIGDNKTVKVKDTLGLSEKEQNYCYIRKSDNGYEISLEPFGE